MGLPHVPSGIRALLLADLTFNTATSGRCFVKKQAPSVNTPFAVVQIPGNIPMDDRGWASKPLIQVNGWCPDPYPGFDPDLVAWDIAIAAMRVFSEIRTHTYEDDRGSMTFNARLTDGPLPAEDTSRGKGNPLQGYLIRVELTLQHT